MSHPLKRQDASNSRETRKADVQAFLDLNDLHDIIRILQNQPFLETEVETLNHLEIQLKKKLLS